MSASTEQSAEELTAAVSDTPRTRGSFGNRSAQYAAANMAALALRARIDCRGFHPHRLEQRRPDSAVTQTTGSFAATRLIAFRSILQTGFYPFGRVIAPSLA